MLVRVCVLSCFSCVQLFATCIADPVPALVVSLFTLFALFAEPRVGKGPAEAGRRLEELSPGATSLRDCGVALKSRWEMCLLFKIQNGRVQHMRQEW